jgi:hypothetical protein
MTSPDDLLFSEPAGDWRTVFAWFPVRCHDNRLVWLRRVRCRPMRLLGATDEVWWQYAHGEVQ